MQLVAEKLVLSRGGRVIVDHLSFTVGAGEALLLTGRNGAGKTTLIRALGGFLAPTSGAVRLDGFDPERDMREACHYVGHLNANKSSFTVAENLRFWQRYLGGSVSTGEIKARANLRLPSPGTGEGARRADEGLSLKSTTGDGTKSLTCLPASSPVPGEENNSATSGWIAASGLSVGLSGDDALYAAMERFEIDSLADIPAGYLSAGQKRRLGLCRLLLARRPLWLLDEPTVSLDTQSTALLAQIVAEHRAGGGLVIAATHLPLGLDDARELRLAGRTHPTGAEAHA